MINKQVIDNVDVSGCEHLTEIQGCWLSTCDYLKYKDNITNKLCKYNPNCYYKQLKRKEKEYDKAKQNAQDTYDLWQALIESFNILQGEKIKLEQECKKLKQTLAEIKEVLQLYNNTTIGTDKGNGVFEFEVLNGNVLGGKLIYCYDTNPAKKALQKISEVEDD